MARSWYGKCPQCGRELRGLKVLKEHQKRNHPGAPLGLAKKP